MAIRIDVAALLLFLGIVQTTGWSTSGPICSDETTCQAQLHKLVGDLDATHEEMLSKRHTLRALEEFRVGVLEGNRFELPSTQREHLEKGTPLVSEVSFDARHKPISTNVSWHFQRVRSLAEGSRIRFHTFMPLKKSSPKGSPVSLLMTLDADSMLSIHSLEGDVLLDRFDLGHGPSRNITIISLSPNPEKYFVASADDSGTIRVHDLNLVAMRGKKNTDIGKASVESGGREGEAAMGPPGAKKQQDLVITANFSSTFTMPPGETGETRKLNALLPVDRGKKFFFVTGDSLGGISVFYQNGTIKGRIRVTDDLGGVAGLLRGQGDAVLFYSSHEFGFFSIPKIDVQYHPCSGWNAPLFDVAVDPTLSYSRVVLALSDGDVLVFSTVQGKSKTCDLRSKVPRVSNLPFKLHMLKGHVLGLPVPVGGADVQADHTREMFFFNLAEMEADYGTRPSRAVTLQASFKPLQPEAFSLLQGSGSGSGPAASKSQIALRFVHSPGVELFELNMKMPPDVENANGGGGGSKSFDPFAYVDKGSKDGGSDWTGYWVFAMILFSVVAFNIMKVQSAQSNREYDDLGMRIREERIGADEDDD